MNHWSFNNVRVPIPMSISINLKDFIENDKTEIKTFYEKTDIKECCICLEEDNHEYIKTKCSHVYHKNCLSEWLKINTSCPICRSEMNTDIKYTMSIDDLEYYTYTTNSLFLSMQIRHVETESFLQQIERDLIEIEPRIEPKEKKREKHRDFMKRMKRSGRKQKKY